VRRVGNSAHRQRRQAVFGHDALGLRAKRFARRLVMFSGAAHA
jgi:hypothetical protein